jgi:hypothetical protein
MMKTTKIIQKAAFSCIFALILLCVQCKKKEAPCLSCTVQFKEKSSGLEASLPLNTLEECEQAKTEIGQTATENGVTITITGVTCK